MITLELSEYEANVVNAALYFHAAELCRNQHTYNQAVETAQIMARLADKMEPIPKQLASYGALS